MFGEGFICEPAAGNTPPGGEELGDDHLGPKGELEQHAAAPILRGFLEENRSELSFRACKYPQGKKSVRGRDKSNVPRQGAFRKHHTFGKPSGIQQTHEVCWKAGPERRGKQVRKAGGQIIKKPIGYADESGFYLRNKGKPEKDVQYCLWDFFFLIYYEVRKCIKHEGKNKIIS